MDFYSLQTSFLANTTVSAQYNRMLATLATMASMIAQLWQLSVWQQHC